MKRRWLTSSKWDLLRIGTVVMCIALGIYYMIVVTPWILGWNQGINEFGILNPVAPQKATVVLRIFPVSNNKAIGFELHHIILPPKTCVEKIGLRENADHLTFSNGIEKTSRFALPYKQKPIFRRDDQDWAGGTDNDYTEINYGSCSNDKALWVDGSKGLVEHRDESTKSNPTLSAKPDRMTLYYYPFDQQTAEMDIYGVFTKNLERNHNSSLSSPIGFRISGWSEFPQFDETISINQPQIASSGSIRIDLFRQQAKRLLTVVLLSSVLLFIGFLPFASQASTFIELSVAVVFGLWGIQGIIIPADISEPTIVQSCIVALYTLYALVALVRIFGIGTWRLIERIEKRHQKR